MLTALSFGNLSRNPARVVISSVRFAGSVMLSTFVQSLKADASNSIGSALPGATTMVLSCLHE